MKTSQLGFVSTFVGIKHRAENLMLKIASQAGVNKDAATLADAITKYNNLRLLIDQLMLQLMADLAIEAKTKTYNRFNAFFREIDRPYTSRDEKTIIDHPKYTQHVREISDAVDLFLAIEKEISFKDAFFGGAEVVGIAGLIVGIFTGHRDFQQKKASGISEILKGLRLIAIPDLGKPPKPEEK